jgi:hypothetical protein
MLEIWCCSPFNQSKEKDEMKVGRNLLVMATLAKRKRTKASIMVFSSISIEANTFDSKQIIFETKRTH